MLMRLSELARLCGAKLVGSDAQVSGVASTASAASGDLVFVENEKFLDQALSSQAGGVIAGEFAALAKAKKPLLIAKQPRLAFAHAAAALLEPPAVRSGIHPAAVVDASAHLGKDVSIGAYAVIGQNVELGDGTIIASGAKIGAGVKIGRDCRLAYNVVIYPQTSLGDRCIVQAGAVLGSSGFGYVRDESTGRYIPFPQIGRLEIGDDVEIGANSTIDRGALDSTVIARGVKLDNLVHIGHNVRIGEDVVIAAQTGISGSSIIEKSAVIAGQVGIGDHVRIGEGVIIGGQSGVLPNKVVRGKGVLFWGTPARPLKQYLKELATLARLAKK